MQVYLVIFMKCSRKKAVRALCVANSDPSRQFNKRQKQQQKNSALLQRESLKPGTTWWESIKLLESTHLTDLKVT